MPLTDYDPAACVQRGITLLNHVQPGWGSAVDTETLDISNIYRCVLTQVFGECDKSLCRLKDIAGYSEFGILRFAVDYGFDGPMYGTTADEYYQGSAALTDEWVRRIAEMRKQ